MGPKARGISTRRICIRKNRVKRRQKIVKWERTRFRKRGRENLKTPCTSSTSWKRKCASWPNWKQHKTSLKKVGKKTRTRNRKARFQNEGKYWSFVVTILLSHIQLIELRNA